MAFPHLSGFKLPVSLKINEKKILRLIDRLEIARSDSLSFIELEGVRIAAVPLKVTQYQSIGDFISHMSISIGAAVSAGAQLVCLPEWTGMLCVGLIPEYAKLCGELDDLHGAERGHILRDFLYKYNNYLQEVYFLVFAELACQYGVYLQPGTFYMVEEEKLYHRGYLFDPTGDVIGFQNKTHLSALEISMGVTAGDKVRIIGTKIGKIFIAIGEDNLFYETYRIARCRGAQIAAAPCSAQDFGAPRDQHTGAYLRVQESFLYAAKSCLRGPLFGQSCTGKTAVYGPANLPGGKNGVVAYSENGSEAQCAKIDISRLGEAYDDYNSDLNRAFLTTFSEKHYQLPKAEQTTLQLETVLPQL